jgi:hypothetical protein
MKAISILIALVVHSCSLAQPADLRIGAKFSKSARITALGSNGNYKWVGTDKGLYRINLKKGSMKHYSLSNTGFMQNHVTALYCLQDGCVWITTDHGLLKYDNFTFIPYTTENSNLPEDLLTGIAGCIGDDLVIETAHFGNMRLHRNRFFPAPEEGELKAGKTTKEKSKPRKELALK